MMPLQPCPSKYRYIGVEVTYLFRVSTRTAVAQTYNQMRQLVKLDKNGNPE
jgi:hypothetical protein